MCTWAATAAASRILVSIQILIRRAARVNQVTPHHKLCSVGALAPCFGEVGCPEALTAVSAAIAGAGKPPSAARPTGCTGSSTKNVDPAPTALSTPMCPPNRCVICEQMYSPRPVPLDACSLPASIWLKARNRRATFSGDMPTPPSCTSSRTHISGVPVSAAGTERSTNNDEGGMLPENGVGPRAVVSSARVRWARIRRALWPGAQSLRTSGRTACGTGPTAVHLPIRYPLASHCSRKTSTADASKLERFWQGLLTSHSHSKH
jgi:hypothetical protein